MNNPLISVIIPVYKTEKYLDKCMESVVSQTYENLEIILVDDGSPDGCPAMCDSWAERDGRIKVMHKENGGVSSARNTALDIAKGEYITFVDSDDRIDGEMLEALVSSALSENSDVSICGFVFESADGTNRCQELTGTVITGNDILFEFVGDKAIRPEIAAKLFKSDLIGNLRLDSSFGYGEDALFNYYIMKKAEKISVVDKCMYHYVQDSGNSSTTPVITNERAESYRIFEIIMLDCKSNDPLFRTAVWRFATVTLAVLSRVLQNEEISKKYFDEIADCLIKYKKDIFLNSRITARSKTIVFLLSVNRNLVKKLSYKLRGFYE